MLPALEIRIQSINRRAGHATACAPGPTGLRKAGGNIFKRKELAEIRYEQ
jgi:hypothetical protein